jgi:hypothetical protein
LNSRFPLKLHLRVPTPVRGNVFLLFHFDDLALAERLGDLIGGRHVRPVIEMGVDPLGGRDLAVPEPLLDVLHRHALVAQQDRARVSEVVEADLPQPLFLQELRKIPADVVRVHQGPVLVHVDVIVVRVMVAVAIRVLGVVEVLHRRADPHPPPFQLLWACVDEDVPVYPAVPVEVRLSPDLVPVFQHFQNRLNRSFGHVELLGEPGDLHRPAGMVDDVVFHDEPPLGRGRLAELDGLLAILSFGLEKDVSGLRLLDPGALLPRGRSVLAVVDDVLVDVLLLYHASNYRVRIPVNPQREN